MKKRFLVLALTLVMVFTCAFPLTASAADVGASSAGSKGTFLSLDEAGLSYEEALAILGMSADEISKENFFVIPVDASPASTNDTVEVPGGTAHQSNFTYTSTGSYRYGTNVYTALDNAPYVQWAAVVATLSDESATVTVQCMRNDSGAIVGKAGTVSLSNNTYRSERLATGQYGSSFKFRYLAPKGVTVTLYMIVAAGS